MSTWGAIFEECGFQIRSKINGTNLANWWVTKFLSRTNKVNNSDKILVKNIRKFHLRKMKSSKGESGIIRTNITWKYTQLIPQTTGVIIWSTIDACFLVLES